MDPDSTVVAPRRDPLDRNGSDRNGSSVSQGCDTQVALEAHASVHVVAPWQAWSQLELQVVISHVGVCLQSWLQLPPAQSSVQLGPPTHA